MSDPRSVVIVEDDFLIAEDLRAICNELGVDVLDVCHEVEGTFEAVRAARPTHVLMDVRLGGKRDGVDIASEIYDWARDVQLVFVTGSNEPPTLDRIRANLPYRILIKPISPAQLSEALDL